VSDESKQRLVIMGALGVLVVIAGMIVAVMVVVPTGEEERGTPLPPGPGPTLIERDTGHGSGSGSSVGRSDREAALEFLDEVYAKQNGGQKGTRDDALAWLDKIYAQQVAQQNRMAADQPDPDAVFAVDVAAAIKAGQVEGPLGAPVTIVEAWDFG
jgi:hypothetical protein